MKLLFVGRWGSRACDWSSYALLRDNVQHFIEQGEPTERFAALHGIAQAVDDGRCSVNAARLRGEALRASYALAGVPLNEAAISLRTRAILAGSAERPTACGTVRAQQVGWELPVSSVGSAPVAEAAKQFVTAVLALTNRAVDGDVLEVRRHGVPPHFARHTTPKNQARPEVRRTTVMGLALKAICVGLLAAGCGARSTAPPKTPPDVEAEQKSTTNVDQRREKEAPDPVVAPPPAYGNKVVWFHARHEAQAGVASN